MVRAGLLRGVELASLHTCVYVVHRVFFVSGTCMAPMQLLNVEQVVVLQRTHITSHVRSLNFMCMCVCV